jgi:hypothetical protein
VSFTVELTLHLHFNTTCALTTCHLLMFSQHISAPATQKAILNMVGTLHHPPTTPGSPSTHGASSRITVTTTPPSLHAVSILPPPIPADFTDYLSYPMSPAILGSDSLRPSTPALYPLTFLSTDSKQVRSSGRWPERQGSSMYVACG